MPSKEEPPRESGTFSLFRAGPKKEAPKPAIVKVTVKEAAPKKAASAKASAKKEAMDSTKKAAPRSR